MSSASIANADETQTQTAPSAPITSQVAPAAEGNAKQPASQGLEEAAPIPSAQDAETDQARAALQAVINQVNTAKSHADYYLNWGSSGVEAELTSAQGIYNNQSATAADLNNEAATLTNVLKTAIAVDTYILQMYINNAPHLLRDEFTSETLAVYDAAVTKGRADLAAPGVTQATLDADAQAIQKALDNLEYTPARWKQILQDDVNGAYAGHFNQADYTAESWKVFDEARSAAKAGLQSTADYKALDISLRAAEGGLKKTVNSGSAEGTNTGAKSLQAAGNNNGTKAKGGKLANTGSNVAVVALVMFAALAAAGSLNLLRRRI
ncbi:hypothetical protein OZX72_00435 [Bifidobacterium sp. ESL0769]|uniref:hypothetical protein n=1 Tax=Bifidobacterium sp. ESL0769 TaxID=2983229 RepID=UPI0023FA3166|nr:hypothetical protein [Bifidobacterium sp. ESL0769]WEV67516.1 hypothetical protein OZX72_00435 [Bifidobacterium sp. ESL0769]